MVAVGGWGYILPLNHMDFILFSDGHSVMIEDGFFSWSSHGPSCLQRLNLAVKAGSLVAVVGHVGSGKSSLLSAMLGEMERTSGFVSMKVTLGSESGEAEGVDG